MKSKPKTEADLGVKIGTPEEVIWTNVMKEAEVLIEQSKNNLIVQEALLKLAKEKIEEEKNKLKEQKSLYSL